MYIIVCNSQKFSVPGDGFKVIPPNFDCVVTN